MPAFVPCNCNYLCLLHLAGKFFQADSLLFSANSVPLVDIAQGPAQTVPIASKRYGTTMHIYTAFVRADGIVVQTQVCANSLIEAIALLKGAYGSDNLVHLPQLVG